MEEQEVHVGPMWYDYEVKEKMGEFIKANPDFSDQDSIKYVKYLRKNFNHVFRVELFDKTWLVKSIKS